ncbi:hypothetical protein JD969_02300 [Planctomycetota bacterium]|nr:hypothetical protein JD969_02300 [Planctomycetota bacterium]
MTTSTSLTVSCPSCGKKYVWKSHFAGKELGCPCGHAFIPKNPEVSVKKSSKAGANQEAVKGQSGSQHSFGLYAQACGQTSAVKRALDERVDDITPSVVKDWYLPLICIPVGWLVTMALSIYVMGDAATGSYVGIAAIAAQIVLFIPTALWALLFVAKWFDLAFADLKTTLLKIAALTFLPAAICDVALVQIMAIAGFDPWYLAACMAPYIFLCGVPTALMFGMQLNEAGIFLVLMFVPRGAAYFGLATVFPDYFNRSF